MFHPLALYSMNPFRMFSLIFSWYHSATPCLTLRTRTVVELTPAMSAGSSVANSGMLCRDSCFSRRRWAHVHELVLVAVVGG
jgi:hypothetical protein